MSGQDNARENGIKAVEYEKAIELTRYTPLLLVSDTPKGTLTPQLNTRRNPRYDSLTVNQQVPLTPQIRPRRLRQRFHPIRHHPRHLLRPDSAPGGSRSTHSAHNAESLYLQLAIVRNPPSAPRHKSIYDHDPGSDPWPRLNVQPLLHCTECGLAEGCGTGGCDL